MEIIPQWLTQNVKSFFVTIDQKNTHLYLATHSAFLGLLHHSSGSWVTKCQESSNKHWRFVVHYVIKMPIEKYATSFPWESRPIFSWLTATLWLLTTCPLGRSCQVLIHYCWLSLYFSKNIDSGCALANPVEWIFRTFPYHHSRTRSTC